MVAGLNATSHKSTSRVARKTQGKEFAMIAQMRDVMESVASNGLLYQLKVRSPIDHSPCIARFGPVDFAPFRLT